MNELLLRAGIRQGLTCDVDATSSDLATVIAHGSLEGEAGESGYPTNGKRLDEVGTGTRRVPGNDA